MYSSSHGGNNTCKALQRKVVNILAKGRAVRIGDPTDALRVLLQAINPKIRSNTLNFQILF